MNSRTVAPSIEQKQDWHDQLMAAQTE